MSSVRYAIYFTPPPDSGLARLGASVLGYDCYTGSPVSQPAIQGIEPAELLAGTVEPRRYGFHGTLKAPFTLDQGWTFEDLRNSVVKFAKERPAFETGTISPRRIGRFIAMTPDEPCSELTLFAAECVAAFDHFRRPLSNEDRQRRAVHNLSPRQQALLERWGYPYVFDQFRFHMTLTGPLAEERVGRWLDSLGQYISGPKALVIDAVTLLEQASADARFRVVERFELRG